MKVLCENRHCRWTGDDSELLRAPNPFEPDDIITACPKCKSIEDITTACDEPGCNLAATCGTPTPTGYRWTCNWHTPHKQPAAPPAEVNHE